MTCKSSSNIYTEVKEKKKCQRRVTIYFFLVNDVYIQIKLIHPTCKTKSEISKTSYYPRKEHFRENSIDERRCRTF